MKSKKLVAVILSMAVFSGGCSAPTVNEKTSEVKQTEENNEEVRETETAEDSEITKIAKKILDEKIPVEISFWTGTGNANYPYLESMVHKFQEKYSNIKVDFSNQGPITELTDKLTQNIVSKTTPTLSNLSPSSFLEYIDSGAIVDMAQYYNDPVVGYTEEEKADFYQNYLEEAESFGGIGTLFGFPTNKKTSNILVYNKTYFDEKGWKAPETWEEVENYAKEIFADTGKPGFSYDTSYADDAFKSMSQQWGSPYIKEDGTIDINNDASREVLKFYKNNMDAGIFTLPALMPSAGGNNSSNGFVKEECYMFVGAAAGIDYAVPKAESGNTVFEIGVSHVPQKNGGTTVYYSKGEDYCIFSNATEEQRVAAWLLVKFLSEPEENVEWYVNTGNLPIRKSMLDIPEYNSFLTCTKDSPNYYKAIAVNAVLEIQDNLSFERVIENSADLSSECGTLWQSVMIGGADPDTSLTDVVKKLE